MPLDVATQLVNYVRWRWISCECRLTIGEEIELLENASIEKSKLLLDQLSILKAAVGAPPGVSIDVSVDIPRLRAYVDFDSIEDRSVYIKETQHRLYRIFHIADQKANFMESIL